MLAYKGVDFDKTAKKADLCWLLALEMRGSYPSPVEASGESGGAGTSRLEPESDGSEGHESGSESSEWPHSQADDD